MIFEKIDKRNKENENKINIIILIPVYIIHRLLCVYMRGK